MQARTAFLSLSVVGAICAIQPLRAAVVSLPVPAAAEKLIETGIATWYGGPHAWHRTASGEAFEPLSLTAAHRNLPLGTVVRVTDVATGRSVIVRVNDREPPHGRRCIDLSEGAGNALGIHRRGVAHVTITALYPNEAVEVAEAPAGPGATEPNTPAAATPRIRHRRARH
ncbi:MAG: septal ring lytic transglycosylase RlpA family protein [Rhodospirillales bacterium]